ncbi:MAG: hypothetical protein AMXMBFR33_59590 [Candidatus Xenobia bacterium]
MDVQGNNLMRYANGYEKLRQNFDKNNDGQVAGDELHGLSVWADANGDGVTQGGELRSVQDVGIQSFDLSNINSSDMSARYTIR